MSDVLPPQFHPGHVPLSLLLTLNPPIWKRFPLTSFSSTEGVNYEEIDAKDPDQLTEVEKIALLGRPRLGDITKVQIRIKESKEFKVRSHLFFILGKTT